MADDAIVELRRELYDLAQIVGAQGYLLEEFMVAVFRGMGHGKAEFGRFASDALEGYRFHGVEHPRVIEAAAMAHGARLHLIDLLQQIGDRFPPPAA